MMAAVAGLLLLFILFMTGLGFIVASVIGLILCRVYEKKHSVKCKLFIKIILWILLIVGIAVICYPLIYFYLIVSTW